MSFSDFKAKEHSEKIVLAILEPSTRLIGWSLYSGSIYSIDEISESKIVSIEDSGVAYTEVSSLSNVTTSTYYYDQLNSRLYIRTSDSSNPNSKFLVMTVRRYFSNVGVNIAHDLNTGFAVHWEPLVSRTSEFGVGLDNKEQFGLAIEGSGSLSFLNYRGYWDFIYENFYWENKICEVYMWNRELIPSDAKLIFKGRISAKSWSETEVKFSFKDILTELKAPILLDDLSDLSGAVIGSDFNKAKQRRVYGKVNGHVPSPIDRINDAYYLSGTVSISTSSATLTGSSTTFLKHFTAEDKIILTGSEEEFTIESVDSDTQMTLSQPFDEASLSGVTYAIIPKEKKALPYANRRYQVAHHATKEPSTTVSGFLSFTTILVASTDDFEAGAEVVINSQVLRISTITGNKLVFTTTLNSRPANGTAVVRSSIFNVKISDRALTNLRDYTYNAATAILEIDDLAEFNIASTRSIIGTCSFTNGSKSVTGSGTIFTSQLKPRDWIRADGQVSFFEVLSIESDTALTLRTNSSYTESSVDSKYKSPEYLDEEVDVVNCSVLGKTHNGLKTGTFLDKAPEIVEDLLTEVGLSSFLDSASFDEAIELSKQQVGYVIPSEVASDEAPTIREVIEDLNRSVFSALIQNNQFLLQYNLLQPDKATALRVDESDILDFRVESRSDRVVKQVQVEYNNKEFDYITLEKSFDLVTKDSDVGRYLAKTNNIYRTNTRLVSVDDANTIAERFIFFRENSSSVITFDTKMQAIELEVNDKIEFDHVKLFERVGSNDKNRVALVQAIKKSERGVEIEIEDLSNALIRTASLSEADSDEFDSSNKVQRVRNGYFTDENGLISNRKLSHGVNRIW